MDRLKNAAEFREDQGMKRFSAASFRASDSGKRFKTVIGAHLRILDGMPVQFENGFGRILYSFNGEEWELYPVMPEWCEEDMQQRLEI